MTCIDCGKPVNPDANGVWIEVVCWSIKRSGGGGNRRDLKPTGRMICSDCGRLRDLGITPGQQSLVAQEMP